MLPTVFNKIVGRISEFSFLLFKGSRNETLSLHISSFLCCPFRSWICSIYPSPVSGPIPCEKAEGRLLLRLKGQSSGMHPSCFSKKKVTILWDSCRLEGREKTGPQSTLNHFTSCSLLLSPGCAGDNCIELGMSHSYWKQMTHLVSERSQKLTWFAPFLIISAWILPTCWL